jgi:hypothetical protein
MFRLRPRSAYDVMAALALFVALSTGGAYAANTVFSEDIVDGEVKTDDLAREAVTQNKLALDSVGSARVINGSLTGADIHDNSIRAADIASDAIGVRELGGFRYSTQTTSIPPSGGVGEVIAECPRGSSLLSGGAYFAFPSGDLSRSTKSFTGERWIAAGQNNGNLAQDLSALAICLVVDGA